MSNFCKSISRKFKFYQKNPVKIFIMDHNIYEHFVYMMSMTYSKMGSILFCQTFQHSIHNKTFVRSACVRIVTWYDRGWFHNKMNSLPHSIVSVFLSVTLHTLLMFNFDSFPLNSICI